MGFCFVDWSEKLGVGWESRQGDEGRASVGGLGSVCREVGWWLEGLGALCARREGGMGSLRSGLRPVAFGDAPSRRFAPLGRTGGFE